MLRLLIFTLFIGTLAIVGCNDDDGGVDIDDCGQNFIWSMEVGDELNDLVAAGIAYGNNPNDETCNDYKDAYQNYIDALRDIDDCVPASDRDEWQQALDEAEDELENLC
jgi:hypothetical protein